MCVYVCGAELSLIGFISQNKWEKLGLSVFNQSTSFIQDLLDSPKNIVYFFKKQQQQQQQQLSSIL